MRGGNAIAYLGRCRDSSGRHGRSTRRTYSPCLGTLPLSEVGGLGLTLLPEDTMKIAIAAFVLLVVLPGCTTPQTVLKNEATGQVVTCGGDTTSSWAGGYIGYSLAKDDAVRCANAYEAQGFKKVN